jgi:hypothetical protein
MRLQMRKLTISIEETAELVMFIIVWSVHTSALMHVVLETTKAIEVQARLREIAFVTSKGHLRHGAMTE